MSQGHVADSGDAPNGGVTVWLTGLPSSGKSTIAHHAASRLASSGHRVEVLDGDEVRAILGSGGFDRSGRDENVKRIGWLANLLARNGVKVIVAAIAPYNRARHAVRSRHEQAGIPFVEVHVAAPIECCVDRDMKGLYASQRLGLITGLTGIDDPYEIPEGPELRLRTDREEVSRSVERLMAYLTEHRLA